MNSLAKGKRNEKKAIELYQKLYPQSLMERKPHNKWGGKDLYNLFDFLIVDLAGEKYWVQVKTNKINDKKKLMKDIRDFGRIYGSPYDCFDIVLYEDYEKTPKILRFYRYYEDFRELNLELSQTLLEKNKILYFQE